MSGVVEGPRADGRRSTDDERTQARSRTTHDVFVSYSHQDKTVADAVVARLEQAGIRCWIAPRDVLPGRVWGAAIVEAIADARLMVLVLSDGSNHSPQVVREVERAVANNVVIVPLRIESIEPTGAMSYYLSSGHWLDAMTPPLESHLGRLVEVAHALLGTGPMAEPVPSPQAPASPPQTPASPPQAPAPPPPPPTAPRRRGWLLPALLAAGALVAAGILGLALLSTDAPGPETEQMALNDLTPGMCLQTPEEAVGNQRAYWEAGDFWASAVVAVVPCEAPHGAEVFFVEDEWSDTIFTGLMYPGQDRIIDGWLDTCERELEAYVGTPWMESRFDFTGWFPIDLEAWNAGDRQIGCIAYDSYGEDLEGSIEGRAE